MDIVKFNKLYSLKLLYIFIKLYKLVYESLCFKNTLWTLNVWFKSFDSP